MSGFLPSLGRCGLFLLILIAGSFGDVTKVVTRDFRLEQVAADIQASGDRGVHEVQFAAYSNVGRIRLTSANASTIIFTRKSPSDSVIPVGTEPLFDIKGVTSTIHLRNLAFKLTHPNSVLISGADGGAPNRNLLLDSCFIFSDNNSARFLSWIADNSGTITIRNSFLVSKEGRGASISIEGNVVELRNNNFNYAGLVLTSTRDRLLVDNNTFNRTQLSANGQFLSSEYFITDNLFAFPAKHNALGVGGDKLFYPVWLQAFSTTRNSSAQRNKRYANVWAGFDPLDPESDFPASLNDSIKPYASPKDTSELWNWYILEEKFAGFHNIDNKPVLPYNVFPSESIFRDTLDGKPLSFDIAPSLIPRRADADFDGDTLVAYSDTLRPIWPNAKGITLGKRSTFTLRALTIDTQESLGSPVLLASVGGQYIAPPKGTNVQTTPIRFENAQPTAQSFHPAFYVNLPRGSKRVPLNLRPGDTLNIDSVVQAGGFQYRPVQPPELPRNLRSLRKDFGFVTSAKLHSGEMLFGTTFHDSTPPYDSNQVYWLVNKDTTNLVKASSLNGRQTARVPVPKDSIFEALLVEKLSVPRGKDARQVAGAQILTESANGFQIKIDTVLSDSVIAPDSKHYSDATPGFRITWAGRMKTDSVWLVLDSEVENTDIKRKVFRRVVDTFSNPFPNTPDKDGNIVIRLDLSETGHTYFAAIKNNVVADSTVPQNMDGVLKVIDYKPSVSGVLAFQVLQAEDLQQAIQKDSAFRDMSFVAGRGIQVYKARSSQPYTLKFESPGVTALDTLVVYYLADQVWNSLTTFKLDTTEGHLKVDGIPPKADMVVAFKKKQPPPPPPSNPVTVSAPVVQGDNLTISAAYKDKPTDLITRYCLEIREVDTLGQLRETCTDKVLIGTPIVQPLVPNHVYQYRVRYYDSAAEYGDPPSFTTLVDYGWKPATVRIPVSKKPSRRFHLVGFPFKGKFTQVMHRSEDRPDTSKVKDVDVVLSLHSRKGSPAFDSVINPDSIPYRFDEVSVTPGEALLVASARSYVLSLDTSVRFQPLEPQRLVLDPGWKFLSSPYPVDFPLSRIHGHGKTVPRFLKLVKGSKPNDTTYSWEPATTYLQAFEGYAYYNALPETLTFDLFQDSTIEGLRKGTSASGEELFRARLETPLGSSAMWLSTYRSEAPTPFLPSPGAAVEMRIGGGSGFLIKPVADGMAMDEPVFIRASRATRARFSLAPFLGSAGEVAEVRLLDLATGAVHDPASGEPLELAEGSHAYRLIAGRSDFVTARAHSFQADLPATMTLSQNHPNPFRGITRIALDWPAIEGHSRNATLDVLDMTGRRIWSRDFRDIRAGREVVSLDAGRWRSGVYLYRLTVRSGARRSILEKKMVVLP